MYIATNRTINEQAEGLDTFGLTPSENGPNELRLAKVTASGDDFLVNVIDDVLSEAEVAKISQNHTLQLDPDQTWYASLKVAVELLEWVEKEKKHLLFYVHGYNNDLVDIVKTAQELEKNYNVVVVVFSWPSNGGGSVSGTLAYQSDKDDARVSATAFNRFVDKVRFYHELIARSREQVLLEEAKKKHPNNLEKAQALVTQLLNQKCHVSLNLMCHSMANYLLKYSLIPGNSALRRLTFDNVCLVAADTNNENHSAWLDRMEVRKRLYILINENDFALAWSRRKPGDEQKVRLGHSLESLNSQRVRYINVTKAHGVDNSHSYFDESCVSKNERLHKLFSDLFEGRVAEDNTDVDLRFRADLNVYEL